MRFFKGRQRGEIDFSDLSTLASPTDQRPKRGRGDSPEDIFRDELIEMITRPVTDPSAASPIVPLLLRGEAVIPMNPRKRRAGTGGSGPR